MLALLDITNKKIGVMNSKMDSLKTIVDITENRLLKMIEERDEIRIDKTTVADISGKVDMLVTALGGVRAQDGPGPGPRGRTGTGTRPGKVRPRRAPGARGRRRAKDGF